MTKYILMILLPALFLMSSCKKESAGDKVPVNITFDGRSGESAGSTDKEGMKSLRIIVAKSDSNDDIVFNFDNPVTNGSSKVSIELFSGTYDFYFIANYESAGISDIDNPDLEELEKLILNADPDTYVTENGIPFGEIRKGVKVEEGNSNIFGTDNIVMKRSLAKVSLKFINETGSEVQLQDLKIAGAKAKSGYLFEQEQDEAEGSDLTFDGNISAEGTAFVKYIYPVKKPETDNLPFALTATWNNVPNTTALESGSTKIARNTHVQFTITLKQNGTFEVNCTVLPWTLGGKSEIVYGEKWDGILSQIEDEKYTTDAANKYYMVAYGDENTRRDLVLNLKVTTPKGATWTANVTNGLDFEVIKTEDGSWASGGIDGKDVKITVRAKRAYQVGTAKETELYITLTDNMENLGEQNINTGAGDNLEHPGSLSRIKIRQVSLDEIKYRDAL